MIDIALTTEFAIPRRKKNQSQIEGVVALTWAASQGDLTKADNDRNDGRVGARQVEAGGPKHTHAV